MRVRHTGPMDPLIERFQAEYYGYHGITIARQRQAESVLVAFSESLDGRSLADVEASDLSRYLHAVVAEGLAPTTARKYRGMIWPLLRWMWRGRIITAETWLELKDVELPRGAHGRGVPDPYARYEIKTFWNELAEAYPWYITRSADRRMTRQKKLTPEQEYERAMFYLGRWRRGTSGWQRVQAYARRLQAEAITACALYGGMRRDEIYRLRLANMDPLDAYITVIGARKNRDAEERPRAVPWTTEHFQTAVATWLELRAEIAPEHDAPWLTLWHGHAIQPLGTRQFRMMLTTTGRGWEFRRMRHTACTEMLRAGWPIQTVQKVMGHATITQTLEYTKILPDDVVRVAHTQRTELSSAVQPSFMPTKRAA